MPIVADRSNPPAETLFVQRKIAGMALLAVRMEAPIPLLEMVAMERGVDGRDGETLPVSS